MLWVDTDVERLKHAYAALGEGDQSAAIAMLAPDCEWYESAELPGVDAVRGRDAIASFLDDFLEPWERFEQVVEEVVAGGDRIGLVIHLTAVGRASGLELDTRYAHVWTMRDGLGARVDAYRDPEAARSALADESDTPAAPSPSESTQNAT
jgi:ketosteroid isomerase-like protein